MKSKTILITIIIGIFLITLVVAGIILFKNPKLEENIKSIQGDRNLEYSSSAGSFNPEDTREIGYEFLDDGNVIHIWNTQYPYFFDKDSGIQLTNHYEDYWTKNIFCIGYYNNDEWNKIKCADELTGFNREIETDNLTYVNATLWKDINYEGYDLRFGVEYHLGLDDENLSIKIYMKNIGIDIPFDLGFAWKVTDWEIPHEGIGGDSIFINQTDYDLDGTFDLTFKNMSHTYYDNELEEEVIEYDSYFRGYDWTEFLRVDWDKNLNYAVKMVGNGIQEDFYIALLINAGQFDSGIEKQTTFKWIDAEGDYTGVHWDTAVDGLTDPRSITNNGTDFWIIQGTNTNDIFRYSLDGTFIETFELSEITWMRGISTNNSFFWVQDSLTDKVHKYDMAFNYISNFTQSGDNSNTDSLTQNSTHLFTVDPNDDRVYIYFINGTVIGNWNLNSDNTAGFGITMNDEFIWIVDVGDDLTYKYSHSGTDIINWSLDLVNANSRGITNNGTYFWIIDSTNAEVYQYELEAVGGDSTPPYFTTIPANTTADYNDFWNVTFVATDETSFDSFTVNDTRFTMNSTGALNMTNILGVGQYLLNITINDSSNNINSTIYNVTINQADPSSNMVISGTTPIEYLITSDFSESETNTGDGGCSYSLDLPNLVYGVDTWEFNYSTTGCANYTAGDVVKDLVVNQNDSYVIDITKTSPIEYLTITDFVGIGCPLQLSCSLNISNQIYGAGVINTNFSTPGNINYTSKSTVDGITVNQNDSLVLAISGTTPITYPTITDFVGSGCPDQLSCSLNISNAIYSAGTISSNFSTSGNNNYTAVSITKEITINQATTSLSLSAATPITYGTTTNFAGSGCPAQLTCNLNITNEVYGVGDISGNYSTAGNTNYTHDSDVFTVTINQATGLIFTYINNLRANYNAQNDSLTGKENIWLNATLQTGLGDINLTLNGTEINFGTSPLSNLTNLSLGTYYFNATYLGNENFTADSERWFINISETIPVIIIEEKLGCSPLTRTGYMLVMVFASIAIMIFVSTVVWKAFKEGNISIGNLIVLFITIIVVLALWLASGQNLGASCGPVG